VKHKDNRTAAEEVLPQPDNSRQCLLCGSVKHHPVFQESGIAIVRCDECRHVFSSYAAAAQYDGFWGQDVAQGDTFYWNEAHARMYQDFGRRFLIGRSGRLLDVGCGLGFFLKAVEHYPGWEAHGWEISAAAVQYACHTLGLTNVTSGRLEDSNWPIGSFDVITMWDVIEHVQEPDPLLSRCHALLKDGGICFMHTPNVHIQLPKARLKKLVRGMRPGISYLHPRDHLHHYSLHSIQRLLLRNGFARVGCLHLRPIQSVSGSQSAFLSGLKNAWFKVARALAVLSGGRMNIDNLFVVAYNAAPAERPSEGSWPLMEQR
jgi:2-polyprenyl-3-methyl-5-hydroxy-6-metoxy-1,4-benzoquinol methylase